MPVDPNISLQVTGGSKGLMDPGKPSIANPLEMVGSVADTAGKLNALKLFQHQFAAKLKMGEIVAGAENLDSAIEQGMRDPLVGAFYPEGPKTAAETRNSILSASGAVQTQGQEAVSHFIRNFPAVLQDPTQWGAVKESSLMLASPAVKTQVSKALDAIEKGLTSGLDPDPETAKQQMAQRLTGWAIAAGAGDAIPRILGTPTVQDVGGRLKAGVIAGPQGRPGWLGGEGAGQFVPGNDLVKTIPAGIHSPGGVATPEGGPVGNALALPGGPPTQAAPPPQLHPVSADGRPMVPEGYRPVLPDGTPNTVGGVPIGPAGLRASGLMEAYIGPERHQYENAQQTVSMLQSMGSNFDNMAAGGGFMVPGSAAEARTSLGNLANTFSRMTGGDDIVDSSKVASSEAIQKETQRMGISVLSSLLGTQREAADTIRNMTDKGVPGVSNSPLGARLLISSINQATQRQIELYEFKNWWQAQTRGDLTGAEQEFNRLHPASGYMQKALDEFGLSKEGFASPESVLKARGQGYITNKQALSILNERFPGQAPPAASGGK